MVNETPIKTGYWRINPATQEREWIEGSYQPKKPKLEEEEPITPIEPRVSPLVSSRELYELDVQWRDWWGEYQRTGEYPVTPTEERFKPYYEQWLQAVREFEVAQPPIEGIEPVRPEVPTAEVTELAGIYGLFPSSFVSPEQLADLALPPEERRVQWRIRSEQYLTWEQARYLGFDVPEGSVVKMTPMAEGEPSFSLMPTPGVPQLPVELENTLRAVFPEMFDPSGTYGVSPEEIPAMVVQQIGSWMQADYQGFVSDLNARVGEYEAERILKLFGVTEENILLALSHEKQEERITNTIQGVFPDYTMETFGALIETDFALFFETMQTGGSSLEKRRLLEEMGYKPEEINQIFSRQRLMVDVDGVRRLLTVDIETKAAYDEAGNYVGAYNVATKQFTRAPQENILKDFWDWTTFQSRTLWEQGENFMLSVLPEIIYSEIPEKKEDRVFVEALLSEDIVKFINETNRQQRENFRWLYGQNKAEYDDWVRHHPELLAPVNYQEGAFRHPELLKDPGYYVYELANIVPFLVTVTGMAVLTGGVGLPFVLGTAAIMAPVEGQVVYEDLIRAGAPEDKAAQMAAVAGGIMGLLESAGRIPLLRQVSPLLFGQFKRKAMSELAKQGLFQTVKRFGKAFTISQFAEVVTEVAQEVVSNTAVSFYDENRSIVENLPDIAVKTAVATLLPSAFGAGVSVRMVSKTDQTGLTDLAKKAKGWIQDNKGNWYEQLKFAVKDERGMVILPGKSEEVRPEVTKETWDATPVEQRVILAKDAGLEGKVGSKVFEDLTTEEITKLSKVPKIPVAEPGMPEAGIQPAMIEGVPAIEVRPPARAEIVQISMDDQMKLDQARRQAEEAPPEAKEAYEAQAEITGLKVSHQTDPVATTRVKLAGRNVGLDAFISIKEQTFPEYFTVKQAQALYPALTVESYTQPGTPQFNKVPRDVALDDLTKKLNMTPDQIADRVMAIRQEKRMIKDLEADIKRVETEKPLTPRTDLTTAEVTENWQIVGQPKLTIKQAQALAGFFGEYVMSENAVTAFELQRELWSRTRAERSEEFKSRMQELIVSQGLPVEQAFNQAAQETLAGQLPTVRTDFFEGITGELRQALFTVVFHNKGMQQYPLEMAATITALTNALTGRAIPRIKGKGSILFPEGGSAWDRLNYVFGKQPRVLKAIEKMATESKKLEDVVEGVFHETGRAPMPLDQETADYLRRLQDIPQGYKTLLEPPFDNPVVSDLRSPSDLAFAKAELKLGEYLADGTLTFDEYQLELTKARDTIYPQAPITKYEAPIEKAIKEIPLWPVPVRENVIKALKEIGMLPIDIGNFLRANKASIDFSFWRQQAPLIASHPITFVQANVEAWKSIWSQKSAEASWVRITRDPLFQIYEFAAEEGGDFLRPLIVAKGTAQWKGTEEFGFARGVERILPRFTMWLPHIKISARAFETGTNEHNWLIFNNYYKAMLNLSEQYASGKKTLKPGQVFDIQKEMFDFAKSLANFTARGSLGRYQIAAPALSAMFFAPRMALGRLLSVKDLINANPRVRLEAWKNAATFVSTFGGIILLGAAAGWWEVERDPLNAEYMSIRIGNVRVDPWGGYRQFLVFFARAITKTGVSSVTGAQYDVDPLGLVQTLLRGKAAPLAALFLDFWRGKNFIGEEVDVANKKQWAERIAPFAVWDIYEAYMEDPTVALQIAIPAIVGAGVQTYTGDWAENFPKLGINKYSDNLIYGGPIIYYDTQDFWADTAGQFKGVDPATLTKEKGFPDYIRAIAEARIINEHLSTLPNEKLVRLNADPAKGTTFAGYRLMWLEREKLVAAGDKAEHTVSELQPDGTYKDVTYKGDEALKAFDKDERTRNAHLGNFSQRQFSLLNQYWAITDPKKQAEFLEKHESEIGINPRHDYLRAHPKENAQLAVWGQAKILTKEAYTEFNRLVKELDIPDNAIPELTLPPETSIDTHFTYEEMVTEGTHGSVEADLLLLKDHLAAEEAEVQSYADWKGLQVSDKSVEYLQLRVDNAELFDKLEEAQDIADKTERKIAVDAVRATVVGKETFLDIERRVDAMNKGTREAPIPDEIVNAYVEHMQIVEETSGNSAEAKLNRYDNPELNDYLMNEDYHGDQKAELLDENKDYLDNYLVPRWRIDVEYRDEDVEYNEIPEDDAEARVAYLAGEGLEGKALDRRVKYRQDRRRREVLEMSNKITSDRFPLDQVENFVAYREIEVKGKRQERFLVENPEFAKAMHDIAGLDIPKPEDVPSVEYDNIYDEWKDNFGRLEGLADHESEFYIEDPDLRQQAYDAIRFSPDGKYTAFGLAEIKRNAYGKFVPEQYVEAYVGYYKIIGEGKPANWKLNTGTDLWYEDDWFMMENMDFYRDVYRDLLGNEKWDFTKVPTREVFNQYLTYIALPHLKAKDDFRWLNRELDAWLVVKFDYTPIAEKKRREELSPYERFIEEWAERGAEIEKRLRGLRGE